MKSKFRLFDTDKRGRVRVTQDSQKAQVAKSSIRQSGSRDNEIALGEEYLNGAAFYTYVEVTKLLIQITQAFENRIFRLGYPAESI